MSNLPLVLSDLSKYEERERDIDKNGPTGARGASFGGSWTLLLTPSALREPL
jgi:hypothetical protein